MKIILKHELPIEFKKYASDDIILNFIVEEYSNLNLFFSVINNILKKEYYFGYEDEILYLVIIWQKLKLEWLNKY